MNRRQLAFIFVALTFAVALLSGCGARQYTLEQLTRLGAKSAQGTVSEQSRGSFVLTDASGQQVIFRTGEMTQYIPVDYRSQQNDEVKVTFTESYANTGKLKRTVLQLERLNVPAQNLLPGEPIEGVLVGKHRGSSRYATSYFLKTEGRDQAYLVYISSLETRINLDGRLIDPETFDYARLVKKKVRATIDHRPILRGNAYVIVATDMTVLEQSTK